MTYDRFLLRSFLHTFVVCFVATFGLFVVIDMFENLDELTALNKNAGMISLLKLIATLYGFKCVLFLYQAGALLMVISVMTVLIMLQRSGELHPLLASGIPMYRIALPIIFCSTIVSIGLLLNQELLVPRVAFLEHEMRHPSQSDVESLTDQTTRIWIDGSRINLAERTIEWPIFLLPGPSLVNNNITLLEAEYAVYQPATPDQPAGWLLKNLLSHNGPQIDSVLTQRGREIVKTRLNEREVFVASAITCDQLFKRASSFTSLSTGDLLARIRCPAFSVVTVHRLVMYLHTRFMQPLMNIIAVLVTIPLMIRRESPGLIADSTLCGFMLASLFGITQVCQSLGASHVITPEFAAWAPVVVGGSLSAWLSGVIRT